MFVFRMSILPLANKKVPERVLSALDVPRNNARWIFSVHFHGNEPFECPIKYDIQENHIRLGPFWDYDYYTTLKLKLN